MKVIKIECVNGNSVESWYDSKTRSYVTQTKDAQGNQLGDANFSGTVKGRNSDLQTAINDNGGSI